MKSEYQRCYDRFVISNLCSMDLSIKERASLVQNFFENSSVYYDHLCECLYIQATDAAHMQSLWLMHDGRAYLADRKRSDTDICLMPEGKCPVFTEDITEHLQLICNVMTGAHAGSR